MVAFAPKPSLRLASCCSVVVRNGAYGERRYGLDSTERTANRVSARAAASARAFASSRWRVLAPFSCPSESKSRPCATRRPSTVCSRATSVDGSLASPARPVEKVPVRSQYSAVRNAMRSRSRSTTSRVATDWTRPADRRGMTFFHRTGETS
ncbi:hypothetical protein LRR80_05919 [Streptomyces sp. RO-S4]|nr:hypothetical protein [Streptomyces sp. RO-S4]